MQFRKRAYNPTFNINIHPFTPYSERAHGIPLRPLRPLRPLHAIVPADASPLAREPARTAPESSWAHICSQGAQDFVEVGASEGLQVVEGHGQLRSLASVIGAVVDVLGSVCHQAE